MSLPYFKMYPRDFFEGTAMMDGELKGAYSLLLSLIYMHRGRLPDDARYISGHIGYSVRKWNKLRSELIKWGKIKSENDIISNLRADKEEIILRSYQDKQAQNGRTSNKNKDLQKPPLNQPEPEPEPITTLLGGREAEFYDALGKHYQFAASHPALLILSDPINWIANGCDIDLDILPTVKALSSKANRITTWAYFSNAVYEAKAKRTAPAPEVKPFHSKPARMVGGSLARQQAEQARAMGE